MQTPDISKEFAFFVYLLEEYAASAGMTATEVYRLWQEHDIIAFIEDSYEQYHQESLLNAFQEIDYYLANGKPLYV